MSDDTMALLLTIGILMAMVLWVPAMEMCQATVRRLKRERAWRRFGADGREITDALERDLVTDRR